MKVVLLIVAIVISFRTSTSTLTLLEKNKAYLSFLSSSVTDIISSVEETGEDLADVTVDIELSSITLFYYNQSSSDDYIVSFTLDDISALDTVFNDSKETVFVIHGYLNNYESLVNTEVKAAILGIYDVNLFVVDWPAYTGYVEAYYSVSYVGTYLGEFIKNVSTTYMYSPSSIYLIGHSLGSHISAYAGQALNGTIGRIVGLDPAGPIYNSLQNDSDAHLSSDDALHVQAIHTNSDLWGINYSVGHSDFWVNGGARQPGCAFPDIICSHYAAFIYYAESIISGGFEGIRDGIDINNSTNCQLNTAYMGGYELDERAYRNYTVTTNFEAPYAQGTICNTTD